MIFSPELLQDIRSQFPSLAPDSEGKETIFFDNPGGTQVPLSVVDAIRDYYLTRCANVGGAFATSRRTDETILQARNAMADLLGAPEPANIVFGQSMTALTFHLARSFAEECRPGDEIIVTDIDHDANIAPWLDLQATGVVIRTVPFHRETGTLDTDAFQKTLRSGKTKLVALNHASNALGTITDIAPLIRQAHDAGALVYIDGVQSVPHIPVDVVALDCDFLACSAYKFFGPHMGALYGKREHLERLRPHKVRPAKDIIPYRWEQGTLNHEGLAGITAAIEHIACIGDKVGGSGTLRTRLQYAMDTVQKYEQTLSAHLLTGLARIPGVEVYGLRDPERVSERLPTIAFNRQGETPRAVCERLGESGICCWSGNYYALRIMECLGLQETGGAVRIGLTSYNTVQEIDRFLTLLDMPPKQG